MHSTDICFIILQYSSLTARIGKWAKQTLVGLNPGFSVGKIKKHEHFCLAVFIKLILIKLTLSFKFFQISWKLHNFLLTFSLWQLNISFKIIMIWQFTTFMKLSLYNITKWRRDGLAIFMIYLRDFDLRLCYEIIERNKNFLYLYFVHLTTKYFNSLLSFYVLKLLT